MAELDEITAGSVVGLGNRNNSPFPGKTARGLVAKKTLRFRDCSKV